MCSGIRPNFGKFLKPFINFREQGAAGHRDDAVVGRFPAQLLGDFKPQRLRSFGIIGTNVHVHESPVESVGNFGAEFIHLVVIAFNPDDGRAIDSRAHDFAGLQIGGNKDIRFKFGVSPISRGGSGQISSGGAGNRGKSKFARAG